jgi:hypothetical protein
MILVKLRTIFPPSVIPAVILALSLSCSFKKPKHPEDAVKPRLPECVIIQAENEKRDPDVEAYKNVFNSVALKWKTEVPAAIERLSTPAGDLVLVIPLHAAKSLIQPQIDRVLSLVESGAILVSEGITPLSEKLGVQAGNSVLVQYLQETAYPDVEITWEKAEALRLLKLPAGALILNKEKTSGEATAGLLPRGLGKCLLLAAELDPVSGEGYSRFPYLLHELQRAGIHFPFRSERLSAFFDYGYRREDDLAALAKTWRKIGIQALHVGTWDFFDPDPAKDAFLQKLIRECHQNGILVYGWLELPHVSTKFWQQRPKWREKTAAGSDAHVDWRYVMNLMDPDCYRAVAEGLERLFRRFQWDGVNLSELYFDSPSGKEEPDSFTPLNAIVRSDFKRQFGIDPIDFFRKESPNFWKKNESGWKKFVEYRVELERALNERFIQLLSGFRKTFAPDLDIVLTYVDNIYDTSMRESVGADVAGILRLLERYEFTLVMEDPGTVWHLGPRRYEELAHTYSKLTPRAGQLGIDINIIERDQTTYPTQIQTGTEFLELFYHAGHHFQTVMMYAEQTMLPQDAGLVSCAVSPEIGVEAMDSSIRLNAPASFIYNSGLERTDFYVDDIAWPCVEHGEALMPTGSHALSIARNAWPARPHLIKLNGNLVGARYVSDKVLEFSYNSKARAIAIFDHMPKSLQVDSAAAAIPSTSWVMLPRGSHTARASF